MKELRSERLLLRELREEDADDLAKNMNHAEMNAYMPGPPYPYTKENALWFINKWSDQSLENRRVEFAAEHDGTVVGTVNIHDIQRNQKSCKIGFSIGKPHWRQGYATEAVMRLLEYLFDDVGMHYVAAEAAEGNDGSIGVLEKIGFTKEGFSKEQMFHNGTYFDMHLYGIRKHEFKK